MVNIGNRVQDGSETSDGRESSDESDGDESSDELAGDVVVRGRNLTKTYDSPLPFTRSVEVLRGADLDVRAGEILGIVGENGSGKSTLMKTLVGAMEPDDGEVVVDGVAGWCPQDPLLYDRLTVAETFRLFGTAYGMTGEEIRDARDRLADRLGFEEFLDYRVDQLSGGNRQKVNLSVAVMADPDVLFLDEPYTGFDWQTYLAFWGLTDELTDRGIAVAVISHFVSERERFDRILELADGRLTDVTDADLADRPTEDPRDPTGGANAKGDQSAREAETDA
ncbi:ABC transporter ATP-binding protein (plasmid) [Halorussus limi]|uniref:ABC transporter ATP-binding protein n=1 Tax=Halorussus limi TaxID=2938695 RepID=A0A8U0I116_9EURY|nr:ABC transporter ATP-binding protein [Halorussus limi]UPV76591.1 ABC transporter ATP-binding protein [Halorussus limi]